MEAVIKLDVPDWQIGQPVTVYFKDTMQKHGTCELSNEHKIRELRDLCNTYMMMTTGFGSDYDTGHHIGHVDGLMMARHILCDDGEK